MSVEGNKLEWEDGAVHKGYKRSMTRCPFMFQPLGAILLPRAIPLVEFWIKTSRSVEIVSWPL